MNSYTLLRGLRGPIVRTHPLTGEHIEPVGIVGNKVVWPMMGGAPDDDDDDDDDDDKNDDTGDSGAGDDGADDSPKNDGDDDTVSREEFDKLKRRMQEADKRASAAEAKIKKQEDAKKDELTKAQDRVTELESEVATLRGDLSVIRLQNAFLSANKHEWHDAETALDIAERKGFLDGVVSDDGSIDKKELTKALDKLATEHKYLISKEEKDGVEDIPSGEPTPKRSKNSKDKGARQQELRARFSSLNR